MYRYKKNRPSPQFFGMPSGAKLTDVEKGQIDVLWRRHETKSEIARTLGRSIKVVYNYLKDPAGYGKNRKPVEARKLSNNDKRQIYRLARTTKFSSKQLKKHLGYHYGIDISASHIRRLLREEAGFKYSTPKRRIKLTKAHKSSRFNFSKMHLQPESRLRHALFTDYAPFTCDGLASLQGCWWDPTKDERPTCEARQCGGGSLMVWAGICYSGKTDIYVFRGKQNSKKHTNMLEKFMLPFIRSDSHKLTNCEPGQRPFVQDNATIHTSTHTTGWLELHKIESIEWPSRSPDLNPIENLWSILKLKVYRNNKQYSSLHELEKAIKAAWREIDLERDIRPLIDSIPRRLSYVLEAKGGLAPY